MSDDAVGRLETAWSTPPGPGGWMSAVNHRSIGKRYIVTSLFFFLVAGVLGLVMRVQLAVPEAGVLGPEGYNQMFTMHGTTMMFLFLVPFLEGLGIYIVPLMIGARDMAFPRLNAFGYWIFLIAGVFLLFSFLTGSAPNAGWFNYVPLANVGFSPGPNIGWWVTMVTFLEVAALVAAVELIVTIFMMRAPGMSLDRMPLFVWSVLVMAFMIVFAMPALVVASLFLGLDRLVGTHIYDAAAGGDPVLWQHLFWFFGHPDVYIMLAPALGVVSTVVPVFSGRPIAGYRLHVLSLIAIGFISFGLWVHHMYAEGLPLLGMNFFVAASMMITIPSGIQIFGWIVTMWRGVVRLTTPMLYAFGFLVLFILGGITGVMVASAPFDWQVHDTYFVVAHFHYVLIGAVVFPVFAAIHYWFPKMTGRMLGDKLGRVSFWLVFIGFNVTFFPMHIIGLQGMPRRVFTYPPDADWGPLNLVATNGAFVMAIGVLLVVCNVIGALVGQNRAKDDPWQADTLEWATSSPPPVYNFRYMPVVQSAHPLWQSDHPIRGELASSFLWREAMASPAKIDRETPATTALEAEPTARLMIPGPSLWPLWLASGLTVAFIGAMIHPWLVVVGLVLSAVALAGWHWPAKATFPETAETPSGALPLAPQGRSTAWAGMAVFILIEATVLMSLIASYFYLRTNARVWPPPGLDLPRVGVPAVAQILLVASAGPVLWAQRRRRQGRRITPPLLLGTMAAVAALAMQALHHAGVEYRWYSHAYGSIVWTMSGYSAAHVVVLLGLAAMLVILDRRRTLVGDRPPALEAVALYWYFVAVTSPLTFATLYIAPYVL